MMTMSTKVIKISVSLNNYIVALNFDISLIRLRQSYLIQLGILSKKIILNHYFLKGYRSDDMS